MKDNSSVFVRLDTPLHTRKEMLSGALDTLEILKSMERVRELQERKLRYWEKLKITVNKIRTLNSKLFGDLPQVSLPKPKKLPEKKEVITPSQVTEIKQIKPKKERKENPLTKELDDIRRKLENLKI